MATAKYNSKAKISFVHTLRGGTKWKLGQFGMETVSPNWLTKRYVSLLEVRKVFNGDGQFEGLEKVGSRITFGKWSGIVDSTGRLNLGCMHFGKAMTKQLRKWATR